MEFIIELILELLLEGSIEVSSNRKVSKWIRYPLIIFITTIFFGIILLIIFLGLSLLNDWLLAGIAFLIIGIIMFISAIIKFKKLYIERRNR